MARPLLMISREESDLHGQFCGLSWEEAFVLRETYITNS